MIPICERLHLFFDAELSPEEAEEIRVHLADCVNCQRDLHEMMQIDDVMARWAPPPFRQARASPWIRRLRFVLDTVAVRGGAVLATFVLLAFVGYQNFFAIPHLRDRLVAAQSPQPASWHFLSVSRGGPPVIVASPSHRMVGLTLGMPSGPPLPAYRCEVRDAADRVLWSFVVPAPARGDEIQIVIPAFQLRPGAYSIALAGPESASSVLARYPFTVELGKD